MTKSFLTSKKTIGVPSTKKTAGASIFGIYDLSVLASWHFIRVLRKVRHKPEELLIYCVADVIQRFFEPYHA